MDILYCKSKEKQIKEQMAKIEDQIKMLQDQIASSQNALDQLSQQHIYLQGSLAIVSELNALEDAEKGGTDEES